ncbi:MAG: histidine kinase [Candidatus Latescibacteria bacterium]|nr:histidine kinase [Candidatus Latescibacterota bacterium]MBT5829463.1 histidine kinase [Candidatus Latescibacterota bacterium]
MKNLLKTFPIPMRYVFALAFVLSITIYLQVLIPHLIWYEVNAETWYKTLTPTFVNFLIWAILSPFIYLLLRHCAKFGISVVLLLSLLIAFVHESLTSLVTFGVFILLNQSHLIAKFMAYIYGSLSLGTVSSFLQLWVSIAIFYAAETQKKYQQKQNEIIKLEQELTQAQLNALKMQLQPHFLFNTLNTVSSLMIQNVTDAQNVIAKLADLLRTVLTDAPTQTIPLHKELTFIKNYLSIEQIRFSDRLQIAYHIEPDTENALVPGLLLQPVVENAIKHGISKQAGQGIITITSTQKNDQLQITITDNGAGLQNTNGQSFGIGIQNVQERLNSLYPDQATFTLASITPRGTMATLTLPFKTTHD